MKVIFLSTTDAILEVNRLVCAESGNPHHCYGIGKIESAISTAFYPGSVPFVHGGIARVAAALCFYIVISHGFMDGNKRTGALVAIVFLNQHGLDLQYSLVPEKNINGLADIIESCAAGNISKDELMDWFDNHKMDYNSTSD